MKYISLFLLLGIFWLGFTSSAEAKICGDRFGEQVCISRLKRRAKNYWEYRAEVTIDSKKQSDREIYNCRDRTVIRKGKYPIPFKPGSPGEQVCKTFQKQANSYTSSGW